MARFDVVVPHYNGVVAHPGGQARIQVGPCRVYVIIIIGGIVALEAVAGIDKKDPLPSVRCADAVDGGTDREKGILRPLSVDIAFVEPAPVDVVGKENIKTHLPDFLPAG